MPLHINSTVSTAFRRYRDVSKATFLVIAAMFVLVLGNTINTYLGASQARLVLDDTSTVLASLGDKDTFSIPILEGSVNKVKIALYSADKTTPVETNININCNDITSGAINCTAPQQNQIAKVFPVGISYWIQVTAESTNKEDSAAVVWVKVVNGAVVDGEDASPTDPGSETPDVETPPTVDYQFTLGTNVFHNKNANIRQEVDEELLAGWQLNLYRESAPGADWEYVKSTASTDSGRVSFGAIRGNPGVYHICVVNQLGWTQTPQNWAGTQFHILTNNVSPNKSSEGPYCSSNTFTNEKNHSAVSYLGVRHNDQAGKNQLTMTGHAYENRTTNRLEYRYQPVLAGWTFRLYEEKAGVWNRLAETTTTEANKSYKFVQYEAGIYHICMVNQPGYEFMPVNWPGTAYGINTPNESDALDETSACATTVYDDSSDHSRSKNFAVLDVLAPVDPTDLSYADQNSVTIANGGYTSSPRVIATWGVVGDAKYYEYEHQGVVTRVDGTFYQQDLSDGDDIYEFRVRAVDYSGNVSGWISYSFTLDTVAPVATLESPVEGAVLSGSVSMQGLVEELHPMNSYFAVVSSAGRVVFSETRRTGLSEHNLTWDSTKYPDGAYTIRFEARDLAGNKTDVDSVRVINVVINNTPPVNTGNGDGEYVAGAGTQSGSSGSVNSNSGVSGAGFSSSSLSDAVDTNSVAESVTGVVEGDSTSTLGPLSTGSIFGASDELAEEVGCFKVLGLCWYWWIPIVLAVVIAVWLISYYLDRRKAKTISAHS